MPITFQGGQSMPAVNTPAYGALQSAQNSGTSGAGNFNPTSGALTVNSTPLYNPLVTGGQTATTPVITANNAQADYTAKFNAYNTLSQQIAAQGAQKASQALLDQQTAAQQQLQASETNLKQQGIDIQKTQAIAQQQQAQAKLEAAKAIGQPEGTPTTETPTTGMTGGTTAPTTTSTNPTAPTTTSTNPTAPATPANAQTTALNNEQNQLGQIQAQKDTVAGQSISLLQSLMAGTIPLTGSQSALITSLQSQLTQNEAMQTQANNAYTGQVTQAAFRGGGEYTPAQMAGTIQNAVSVGVARIQQLDNSVAKTIADLEISFQQKNYDVINKQYDILTKQLDDKATAIKDIYTQTTAAIKDARDYTLKVQQYNQDYELKVAQFDETKAKDAITLAQNRYEFRDLKDAMGTTIGTQIFDKQTGKPIASNYASGQTDPQTGVTSPTTATNPDGSVNKESQYATLQAVVPKPYQALVWQIVNGKGEAPNVRTSAGQKLASWVAQVDPTLADGSGGFDSTKYAARLAMQKSLAGYTAGSYGQGVLSANKVISHIASYYNNAVNLPKLSPFGSTINAAATNVLGGIAGGLGATGIQETAGKANTESIGLTDEMTKFFKGTGGTDVESLKSWAGTVNPNSPVGTIKGSTQGTLDLFAGQLNAFINQYKTVMGKDPDPGTILQPQTIQTLSAFKNAGFKVDLPGVYYTDKTAWQNNGGTEQQWHSAVDTLTQLGQPLTDENILQAAQVMNE